MVLLGWCRWDERAPAGASACSGPSTLRAHMVWCLGQALASGSISTAFGVVLYVAQSLMRVTSQARATPVWCVTYRGGLGCGIPVPSLWLPHAALHLQPDAYCGIQPAYCQP